MNREVCGICWCPYDEAGACGCKPLYTAPPHFPNCASLKDDWK